MASTSDSTLYLYTSLTAGSSHIITATSRLETILKANKIAFRAVDCATDEKARMLWGRRSRGRKLPGLVKFGNVIGDIEQIEEWNEFGELAEQIEAADFAGVNPDAGRTPHPSAALPLDIKPPESSSEPASRGSSQGRHISISEPSTKPKTSQQAAAAEPPVNAALRQAGAEAAARAAQRKTSATSEAAKKADEAAKKAEDSANKAVDEAATETKETKDETKNESLQERSADADKAAAKSEES